MKSLTSGRFRLLTLMFILFLAGCTDKGSIDYREKLLVSVEWGAKAGKFGLAIPEEGEIVGPRTFTIDDDGNIHIFDAIKKNIKVYNPEGVFKHSVGKDLPGYSLVVYAGHYYLLDGDNVYQYTFSGAQVETYRIARAINLYEGYGQWMRVDAYGNLYVKSQGKSYRICEGIGRENRVLPEEAQVKSERRGTPGSSGAHWFTLAKETAQRFRLRIQDKNGKLFKEFPVETTDAFGSVIFLDQDEKGVVYFECKRIGEDGGVHLEIRRYKADGRLLQSVELPNNYYTIVYKKIFVDKKGPYISCKRLDQG